MTDNEPHVGEGRKILREPNAEGVQLVETICNCYLKYVTVWFIEIWNLYEEEMVSCMGMTSNDI